MKKRYENIDYSGAAAGSIAVFFVVGLLGIIISSIFFEKFEDAAVFTMFLSLGFMLITQFTLTKELSWRAFEPLFYFGLIGPLWGFVALILILLGIL